MTLRLPKTGIDYLLEDGNAIASLAQKKVGLISHQNALTQDYRVSAEALQEKIGSALTYLFSPEHGWSGQMMEGQKIRNSVDPHLNLPVLSLYGGDQEPFDLDVLIIDLQDVGLRCYTYAATCAQFLEKLPALDVIVCDRPNPLGPHQRGFQLDPAYRSLVGYFDVPFQHGQTLGELLSQHNTKHALTLFSGPHDHEPYHYPWIPPSPNLPSWDAVLLYPGLVLLEGTNISEGRGTSFPFTCLGAPGLNQQQLLSFFSGRQGLRARPLTFTPQSSKWRGEVCTGAHLLLDPDGDLNAFEMGVDLLAFLQEIYAPFEWAQDEDGRYFINLLLGGARLKRS